jgi:outer membrane protein OmpU
MKKILLASTVLVGTTGFAAADVSFTGRAYAGLGYNITTAVLYPEISALFTAGMMTTTDQGLEAGASVTVLAAGQSMQKDPSDAQFGANDWPPAAGVVLGANVYLSGSWGKVAIAYDTNSDGDATTPGDQDITVTYTNTWGNFGLEAYGVLVAPGSTATTGGDLGVKGTYSFGDYSVWASVARDANDADGNVIDVAAGASASIGGFTGAVKATFDIGTGVYYRADLGYATGPYAISAFVESDAVGFAGLDYGAKATYDLGGGVGLEAGVARDFTTASTAVWAGVSMAF